ncbi:hypothetical protein [Polaribacter staleyi]|uniref:hypothetical protein n=1 Tax=Polaribacter staleyi TaxID=2022337 RepID=UPI0031BA4158
MRNILLILIISFFFQSCKKDINEQSISIVESFQKGDVEKIKKEFYSDEYFNDLQNADQIIKKYKTLIGDLEIDKKENIILETRKGTISNGFFPKDSVLITSAYVPVAVEMPSPVPSYFVQLHFVNKNDSYKLVAFDLKNTEVPQNANELNIENKINIDKRRIIDYSFMYEGGYKSPLIFKRKTGLVNELKANKDRFDLLLELINNSKIVKAQKETDTRRFNGDPELGIINLEMNNNHTWTLFTLISEENNKKENFNGTIELRYYQYLNLAVTYWIESENNELLKQTMFELCNSGENIRTEPKESIKLEISHEEK